MHDFADVELVAGSFHHLARLCEADPRFPKDLPDWEARVSSDSAAAHRGGHAPQPMLIDPDRFERWCHTFEVPPCLDSFRAYCIIHRLPRGQGSSGRGGHSPAVLPGDRPGVHEAECHCSNIQ